MACSRRKRGGGLRTLLIGMLAGLLMGLLYAPRPGPETLDDLADKKAKLLDRLSRGLPV